MKINHYKISEFYPTENKPNSILSKNETEKLSKDLSKFYTKIIINLKKNYQKKIDIKNSNFILRRAVVPLTYVFFERCVRSINAQKKKNIRNESLFYSFQKFNYIEEFEDQCSNSIDFNYYLNSNFINILKNKDLKNKNIITHNNFEKINTNKKKINHLTKYYNYTSKIKVYLLRKLEKIVNIFFYYEKLLITNTANSEPSFVKKFFFITKFSRAKKQKLPPSIGYNEKLRDDVFDNLPINLNDFKKVLNSYNITNKQIEQLYRYYLLFLKKYFPIYYLEDVIKNYSIIKKFVQKFKKKILFSSDDESSYSTLLYCVAKNLGFKIIKFQHAAHGGYIKDNVDFEEVESKTCDIYLTLGWKDKIKNICNKYIEFASLPSPWLSEKQKYFANYDLNIKKKYDIIFFPQFVKPYTNSFQGISNFKRDILKSYIETIKTLISVAKKNNFRICIKFYNKATELFLENTLKKLKKKYRQNVIILNNNDKGISKIITQYGEMVIFDQIGTGFFECLICGIPTMVINKGNFCIPNSYSKNFFQDLKKVGLLHNSEKILIKEYKIFILSKDKWMNNSLRKKMIHNFCRSFANTDRFWEKKWLKYLRNL